MRNWLRDMRLQNKKTQEQVGNETGLSHSYICNLELGCRNPTVKDAKTIASCLGFDWTLFYEAKEEVL